MKYVTQCQAEIYEVAHVQFWGEPKLEKRFEMINHGRN